MQAGHGAEVGGAEEFENLVRLEMTDDEGDRLVRCAAIAGIDVTDQIGGFLLQRRVGCKF